MELSEEDLALIQVLQTYPRLGWADAAKVLGVHATTLAARWERLTSSGAAWVTAHLAGDPRQMLLAFRALDIPFSSFLPGHPCQLPSPGVPFGYPAHRPAGFAEWKELATV